MDEMDEIDEIFNRIRNAIVGRDLSGRPIGWTIHDNQAEDNVRINDAESHCVDGQSHVNFVNVGGESVLSIRVNGQSRARVTGHWRLIIIDMVDRQSTLDCQGATANYVRMIDRIDGKSTVFINCSIDFIGTKICGESTLFWEGVKPSIDAEWGGSITHVSDCTIIVRRRMQHVIDEYFRNNLHLIETGAFEECIEHVFQCTNSRFVPIRGGTCSKTACDNKYCKTYWRKNGLNSVTISQNGASQKQTWHILWAFIGYIIPLIAISYGITLIGSSGLLAVISAIVFPAYTFVAGLLLKWLYGFSDFSSLFKTKVVYTTTTDLAKRNGFSTIETNALLWVRYGRREMFSNGDDCAFFGTNPGRLQIDGGVSLRHMSRKKVLLLHQGNVFAIVFLNRENQIKQHAEDGEDHMYHAFSSGHGRYHTHWRSLRTRNINDEWVVEIEDGYLC